MRDGRQQVVILYSHSLLGEGLGRLLAGDPGLEIEMVRVTVLDEARQALGSNPDVVILERTTPIDPIDLMRLAPAALLIDVGLDAGPTWTYRRDEVASCPEELLRAIHARDRTVSASIADGHSGGPASDDGAAAGVRPGSGPVPGRRSTQSLPAGFKATALRGIGA